MVWIYVIRVYQGVDGVYPASKFYVGCSANCRKRWREHRCLLRQGKHACAALQADWDRLPEDHFSVREVHYLGDATVARKREAELSWMQSFADQGILYNDRMISFQGPPGSIEKAQAVAHLKPGNRWTAEANLKRSLAQKGKPKGHGAKISATKRAKSMMR